MANKKVFTNESLATFVDETKQYVDKSVAAITDNNTTYELSQNRNIIILDGSDGEATAVQTVGRNVEGESFMDSNGNNYTGGVGAEVFNYYNTSTSTYAGEPDDGGGSGNSGNTTETLFLSNIASGNYSHAEGLHTIASGASSHAEGDGTKASGNYSHAEGEYTEASWYGAHAEGTSSKASGYGSHAEGQYTKASGNSSHAEGQNTTASGDRSHAEGLGTIASSKNQHVQGKYNIEDTENKYAHIVGNGDSTSARSNAHTLDWDGNAWFAGDVYVGGTAQDNGKELATKEYVDAEITNKQDKVDNALNTTDKTIVGSINELSREIVNLGADILPSYLVSEVERVVNNVQANRNANTFVMTALSDFHVKDGDTSKASSLQSLQSASIGIAELKKRMHIDLMALLGDYSWMSSSSYATNQVKKDITLVKKTLHLDDNELWSIGNHDLNYGKGRDRTLTNDELYAYIGSNSDGVKPYANIERGYGYLDFEAQKIRVINLNTCDASDWEGTSWNTTEGQNSWSEWISPTQIQWLADVALDFSDKENIDDWGIILLGHHSLHYGYECFSNVMKILEAYKNGTSGSIQCAKHSDYLNGNSYREWVYETVTYDFTSGEKAEIICNIHGHNHNCEMSQISSSSWSSEASPVVTPWLWEFCVPNVGVGRENECATNTALSKYGEFDENGNPVYWTKTIGTPQGTSFNVISIDRKNERIYAHIFGAGKDRIINYKEAYTPSVFAITSTLSNCSNASGNPTAIAKNSSTTLIFTANSGYVLPSAIVVNGASYTWDSSTGALVLSNPTDNVSITIVATEDVPQSINLLDVSTRTFATYSEPTYIENTETRDIDYTKCYAVTADGRRGSYPSRKFSDVVLDENGLTATCNSSSGYGIEFPIEVEVGKTYKLERTDPNGGKNMLITFNSDGTLNTTITLRADTNKNQFTAEAGYKYSITFHWGSETKTISNISVIEKR